MSRNNSDDSADHVLASAFLSSRKILMGVNARPNHYLVAGVQLEAGHYKWTYLIR